MPKYIYLYKGPPTDMSAFTEEVVAAVMAQWGAWYGAQGAAIVDQGAPFGMGGSVLDNGAAGEPAMMSGYTVIDAADMDAAKAMTAGHPFLSEDTGDYAIDIFELIDMPAPS